MLLPFFSFGSSTLKAKKTDTYAQTLRFQDCPMPEPSELFTNVYVKGFGTEVITELHGLPFHTSPLYLMILFVDFFLSLWAVIWS